MKIVDSSGEHNKCIESHRFWAYSWFYSLFNIGYQKAGNNTNRSRIFNDIKRDNS